jgi:hypothetical protein
VSGTKTSHEILSFITHLDDSQVRALIALEVLYRSRKDLQEILRKIFSRTWEYKILEALLKFGPMNKAQLCLKLFSKKGMHYSLSRSSSEVFHAFNYLLNRSILVVVKSFGKKRIYDVSSEYKLILELIFHGSIFAQSEP